MWRGIEPRLPEKLWNSLTMKMATVNRAENIKFILDISNGKVEELISYNQLLEHLQTAQDNDLGMDQELFKFRAIIGHQGPLAATDPDWEGSKYNVRVEWETGEIF